MEDGSGTLSKRKFRDDVAIVLSYLKGLSSNWPKELSNRARVSTHGSDSPVNKGVTVHTKKEEGGKKKGKKTGFYTKITAHSDFI